MGAKEATLLRTDKQGVTKQVQVPVEDLMPDDLFLVRQVRRLPRMVWWLRVRRRWMRPC